MKENKATIRHTNLVNRILFASAKCFLAQGYTGTTIKDISAASQLSVGSVTNIYGSKEGILCGLVNFVLESQTAAAERLLNGITDDLVIQFAVETTLQLYIVDSDRHLCELYSCAYSLPDTSEILRRNIADKLEKFLKDRFPGYEKKDYYKLAMAVSGIRRSYITVPCDMWFTIEEKAQSYIENCLLVCRIPQEEIDKTVEFVKQFDFVKTAEETVGYMLKYLEEKQKELL
ncbi:MAG: TetR family transcriptional regulator [Clostridia bacterium]|nr:TetR family transcriptional regulator [Clostridia bacterium]